MQSTAQGGLRCTQLELVSQPAGIPGKDKLGMVQVGMAGAWIEPRLTGDSLAEGHAIVHRYYYIVRGCYGTTSM